MGKREGKDRKAQARAFWLWLGGARWTMVSGVERVERDRRSRKLSSRVRVFDEDQRRQIILKRLRLLEDDQWQEDRRREDEAEDDDYVLSASSGDEVAVG